MYMGPFALLQGTPETGDGVVFSTAAYYIGRDERDEGRTLGKVKKKNERD